MRKPDRALIVRRRAERFVDLCVSLLLASLVAVCGGAFF